MRRKLAIFLILLVLLGSKPVFSQESVSFSSERIKNFSVEINIEKDSSFLVKESIVYDFGENLRHGIYRDIPIEPLGGIKIKIKKVVDEFANPYQYETSKEETGGNYFRIKIGDPNKLIKGVHTYNIFYQVERGLKYFQDHDELYWNVTGNEWEVLIENSSATISLPERISEKDLKLDCFTGTFGSKSRDCTFKVKEDGTVFFASQKSFYPKEGLTIVLGLPKGIVKEPGFLQKLLWNLEIFLPILIPVFVFIYLFREWWLRGKDPKIKKTIIAQYEPPDNLKPAEVSLILNQKLKEKDISATIVDLAVRGYLKIKEIKKTGIFSKTDYEFVKLKDFEKIEEDLAEYERVLLKKIFAFEDKILVSSLKNKFYTHLSTIIDKIFSEVSNSKYFVANPKKITLKWRLIGIIVLVAGYLIFSLILAAGLIDEAYLVPFNFSILCSFFLFFIFAPFMPKRTEKGTEAYWQILGFKEYINTAEKHRAEFYEKENIFEKYLPYAIVFELVNKWAKAFEGIYKTPPSWYEGSFGPGFTSAVFVNSLNKSLTSMTNTFVSRPGGGNSGLGGGGFAGGGVGGGGGGSW